MTIEVKVPVLPESVSDATIATWHKKAGDAVKRDENLVDLETDKVVLEVPAPVDGVIKELKFQTGDDRDQPAGPRGHRGRRRRRCRAGRCAAPAPAAAPAAAAPQAAAKGAEELSRPACASPPSSTSTRPRWPAPAATAA